MLKETDFEELDSLIHSLKNICWLLSKTEEIHTEYRSELGSDPKLEEIWNSKEETIWDFRDELHRKIVRHIEKINKQGK